MAGIVYTKLVESLANLGIDVSKKQSSNVKTLATKNKSSATKVGLLAAERDTGGNFGTVLDIFRKEAQFIEGMNDVERMNFLNNIMDYKEFGGKPIKVSGGISSTEEMAKFKNTQLELKKTLEDLNSTAKTMKDDADAGLKSAEKDLKDFFETGGQPLKAKSDKYLGGSMHEEGQLRTAIRTFLKNEYKNGRIKLDKDDQFRIMEYSPMMEDDPIKVFKKIYGDEAYKKAGTFPGAFEKGENFNHYELIFKENMGEDLLKVKDKKYVGDGTLTLTKQEEVVTPTPDDDVNFAKGGRASFAGGKLVDEFIAMIVKKEPIEAMKEVNKVIGKKGKYKNLTQKDIDRIVDQSNDWVFQRDPDNLYVKGSIGKKEGVFMEDGKTPDYDYYKEILDDAEDSRGFNVAGDETIEELLRREKDMKDEYDYMYDQYKIGKLDPEPGSKSPARLNLLKKRQEEAELTKDYRLFSRDDAEELDELEKFLDQDYKRVKAEQADEMNFEDSIKEMEGLGATQTAERFRLKQKYPGITDDLVDKILIDDNPQRKAELLGTLDEAFKMMEKGKGEEEIIETFKNTSRTKNSTGGRAGYYGGGQATVEPDLSDIGHGSDALMARTRITAPGSQATTSTGLNYLLGEDNDNMRIPFKGGGLTPEDYLKVKDMLDHWHDYKKGGGTMSKSSFANSFFRENNAEGGRIGFAGGRAAFGGGGTMGASDKGYQGGGRDKKGNVSGTAPGAAAVGGGPDDRGNDRQNAVQAMVNAGYTAKEINSITNPSAIDKIKSSRYNTPLTRGILRTGAYMYNPMILGTELRDLMKLKNIYDETKQQVTNPEYNMEDMTLGLITDQQKNIIDKQGKIGQLTGAFDPDQTFEVAKKFDDEGGFFSDAEPMTREEYDQYVEQKGYAEGGLAGLLGERPGYAGGGGIDIARRGFLKFLGGTAAGVAALKAGLVKILGKESGAISKKVIDEVIIEGGSGAPAWLQPLVNKALREGTDISKQAVKDGQVVKSLDTPTGKVDVYYDTRSGEIDIDYIGGNTALGESVNMRYTPGIADEGTKGVKPADEFEAVERIPEQTMFGVDDYELTMGENAVGDVKGLYSDTSELAELGGEKLLIKDISESIKKKKVLKQMGEDPTEFATEGYSTGQYYDPT